MGFKLSRILLVFFGVAFLLLTVLFKTDYFTSFDVDSNQVIISFKNSVPKAKSAVYQQIVVIEEAQKKKEKKAKSTGTNASYKAILAAADSKWTIPDPATVSWSNYHPYTYSLEYISGFTKVKSLVQGMTRFNDATWTDEDGFRRWDDAYCVAIGPYFYGYTVDHNKFKDLFLLAEFENGAILKLHMSDAKGECNTQPPEIAGYYHDNSGQGDGSVIEFIAQNKEESSATLHQATPDKHGLWPTAGSTAPSRRPSMRGILYDGTNIIKMTKLVPLS